MELAWLNSRVVVGMNREPTRILVWVHLYKLCRQGFLPYRYGAGQPTPALTQSSVGCEVGILEMLTSSVFIHSHFSSL